MIIGTATRETEYMDLAPDEVDYRGMTGTFVMVDQDGVPYGVPFQYDGKQRMLSIHGDRDALKPFMTQFQADAHEHWSVQRDLNRDKDVIEGKVMWLQSLERAAMSHRRAA